MTKDNKHLAALGEPVAWGYEGPAMLEDETIIHDKKCFPRRQIYKPAGWTETALYPESAILSLTARIEELEAENARLTADALRYRWLRDHSVPPHNFYIAVPDEFRGVKYNLREVDAYIDAARAALNGGGDV